MLKLSSSSLHFVQIPKIPHIVSVLLKIIISFLNYSTLIPSLLILHFQGWNTLQEREQITLRSLILLQVNLHLLCCCFCASFILLEALFAHHNSIELFLFDSQVCGGLPQRNGALRTGMRMWVSLGLSSCKCYSSKYNIKWTLVKSEVKTDFGAVSLTARSLFESRRLLLFIPTNSLLQLVHSVPLQLSETKIFTASTVASMPLPQENVTITKGQRSLMHFISLNNAFQEIAFPLNWLRKKMTSAWSYRLLFQLELWLCKSSHM